MESKASMDKDDTEVPVYGSTQSMTEESTPSSMDETEQAPVSMDETEQAPSSMDETEQAPASMDETEQAPVSMDETEQAPASMDESAEEPDSMVESAEEPDSMEGEGEGEEQQSESSEISSVPSSKAITVLNKASNFRKKLTTTKRKLPSLDDAQKDKIRNELITEFGNILKLYKNKNTRKKYIRRLNGLRTVFNQSLNKLNGITRHRKRKTGTRKSKEPLMMEESVPEQEPMVTEQASPISEEESI